jgi:hypothetical protein
MIIDMVNVSRIDIIHVVQPVYRVNVWKNLHEPLSVLRNRDVPVNVKASVVHFQKYDRLIDVQNLFRPGKYLQLEALNVNLHKIQTIER